MKIKDTFKKSICTTYIRWINISMQGFTDIIFIALRGLPLLFIKLIGNQS